VLKLMYDVLLSNSAFKFNLRRYTMEKYTAAIAWEPENAVLHSNRAAALLGLRGGAGARLITPKS
jgi:hypothetical protein